MQTRKTANASPNADRLTALPTHVIERTVADMDSRSLAAMRTVSRTMRNSARPAMSASQLKEINDRIKLMSDDIIDMIQKKTDNTLIIHKINAIVHARYSNARGTEYDIGSRDAIKRIFKFACDNTGSHPADDDSLYTVKFTPGVVLHVLNTRPDVFRQDDFDWAFHMAVGGASSGHQHTRVMDRLLELGVDINSLLNQKTPLMRAYDTFVDTPIAVVKYLLDHGADVTATDGRGNTALHQACHSAVKRLDGIKVLVEHGADVNKMNRSGRTPLMLYLTPNTFGTSWFDVQSIKYLLKNGADPDFRNPQGISARMLVPLYAERILYSESDRKKYLDIVKKAL